MMTKSEFIKLHKGADYLRSELNDLWERYKIGLYDPTGSTHPRTLPSPKTGAQQRNLQQFLSRSRGPMDIESMFEPETPEQKRKRLEPEFELPRQGYPIGKPLNNPANQQLLLSLLLGVGLGYWLRNK